MRKHMRYDQLDTEELEQLQNDSYLEKWKKNFVIRFFEQLQIKDLQKKDVAERVTPKTNRFNLLPDDFSLSTSTLTECTKYNPTKKLRALSVNNLIAISNALEVSIDYLLGIEDCESHLETDINKVTGLNKSAILKLQENNYCSEQLNSFLANSKIDKLIALIKDQQTMHSLYKGLSGEFSQSLYDKLKSAYERMYSNKSFTLDHTPKSYTQCLFTELPYKEIVHTNSHYKTFQEYIEKNVSYGVSSGFYQNEKEVIFTDKDIYDKFIPYIADFLFDTLEHYYNRDMQILRISQLFSEIIKEYIDYQ
ncbi:MAG: hypothetical protein ACLTPJ_12405 [Faecalimonas sp.]